MPNTAAVYTRIDPELKKDVDEILKELCVTPSSLIQMLYAQIRLTKKIPFEIKLPSQEPIFLDEISEEELNKRIDEGLKDIKEGRTYTQEEVDAMLKKKLNNK